jgi:FkbM family methyltransferase
MYENGASVRVSVNGTIASYLGISFYMRSIEDFQIANEVFVFNEYNFQTERDCIAVDVGMNVGLTSLFLANLPTVTEVYSFEPFAAPYRRALENFDLNPRLSPKIKAYNYGFGADDQLLTVYSDENSTIGTSVKGLSAGRPEEITIRDASTELRKIINRAKHHNLDVVVKIDCEGSEFAIFDRLDKHDLIKEARVFLIEWHKWWSADKTQREIVSCLTKNDFIVFDRTVPTLISGQLYAIRTCSNR